MTIIYIRALRLRQGETDRFGRPDELAPVGARRRLVGVLSTGTAEGQHGRRRSEATARPFGLTAAAAADQRLLVAASDELDWDRWLKTQKHHGDRRQSPQGAILGSIRSPRPLGDEIVVSPGQHAQYSRI
jgi:hypothetical protein